MHPTLGKLYIASDLDFLANITATRALACSSIPKPYLNGTDIASFTSELKPQWTSADSLIPQLELEAMLGISTYNISYCQVSMTYTHPGWNDTVNIQVWLPDSDSWNGRFQGTGGSGWRGGTFDQQLLPAIINGYAAASTDAGHNVTELTPDSWALSSEGNVDLPTLQDFGSVTLNELSIFGKQITTSFYAKAPAYS